MKKLLIGLILLVLVGCSPKVAVTDLIVDTSAVDDVGHEHITEYDRTYMFDDEGNYIELDEVVELLGVKYFGGETVELSNSNGIIIIDFRHLPEISEDELSKEELFCKFTMLLQELKHYKYYFFDVERIDIGVEVTRGYYSYSSYSISISKMILYYDGFKIDVNNLLSNKYDILFNDHSGNMVDGEFIHDAYLNIDLINQLYEQYLLDETYDGYVLNYE